MEISSLLPETTKLIEATLAFLASESNVLPANTIINECFELWFDFFIDYAATNLENYLRNSNSEIRNFIQKSQFNSYTAMKFIENLLSKVKAEIDRLSIPLKRYSPKKDLPKYLELYDRMIYAKMNPYFVYHLSPILVNCLEGYVNDRLDRNVKDSQHWEFIDISLYDLSNTIEAPFVEYLHLLINKKINNIFSDDLQFDSSQLESNLAFLSDFIFPALAIFSDLERVRSIKHRLEFHVYKSFLTHLTKYLFEIIVEYPDSEPSLRDLKVLII